MTAMPLATIGGESEVSGPRGRGGRGGGGGRGGRGGGRGGRRPPRRRPPPPEEEEEESETGREKKARGTRRIRALLKSAAGIKAIIQKLKVGKPPRWRARVAKQEGLLKARLAEAKRLGWKPKAPPKKPGNKSPGREAAQEEYDLDLDAELEAVPAEPGEQDELIDEVLDEEEGELAGNWIDDAAFGDDAPKPWQKITEKVKAAASKGLPTFGPGQKLGNAAVVKARPGHRTTVMEVEPGTYIVTVVSDAALNKLAKTAGVDVGVVPLLMLAPNIIKKVTKKVAPGSPNATKEVPHGVPELTESSTEGCRCR